MVTKLFIHKIINLYIREEGRKLSTGITVRNNETIESALKRFRRAVQQDGVLKDARKHEFYEKPSERKKKLKAAAKKGINK